MMFRVVGRSPNSNPNFSITRPGVSSVDGADCLSQRTQRASAFTRRSCICHAQMDCAHGQITGRMSKPRSPLLRHQPLFCAGAGCRHCRQGHGLLVRIPMLTHIMTGNSRLEGLCLSQTRMMNVIPAPHRAESAFCVVNKRSLDGQSFANARIPVAPYHLCPSASRFEWQLPVISMASVTQVFGAPCMSLSFLSLKSQDSRGNRQRFEAQCQPNPKSWIPKPAAQRGVNFEAKLYV